MNLEYVIFYCVCGGYNLNSIATYLQNKSIKSKIYSKDVLHFKFDDPMHKHSSDIFIYSYGCVVFWDVTQSEVDKLLEEFSQFATDILELKYIHSDKCQYKVSKDNEGSFIDMENDIIVLHQDTNISLAKLAFAYGLSQSVKLSVFESSVDKTIESNKSIPNELINTGKISMSKKALAQKVGSLFAEKNYINLNNNILDTPEFFWKHPRYEQYYEMSIRFLDLKQRIHILNSKLDLIRDLYTILLDELKHAQSSRLEIVVILLIFLEVCISLLELYLFR